MLSHHNNIWCMESFKIVYDNLLKQINHLFTAILLVALLFVCQEMPKSESPLPTFSQSKQ